MRRTSSPSARSSTVSPEVSCGADECDGEDKGVLKNGGSFDDGGKSWKEAIGGEVCAATSAEQKCIKRRAKSADGEGAPFGESEYGHG
jgi:hypothetical protein